MQLKHSLTRCSGSGRMTPVSGHACKGRCNMGDPFGPRNGRDHFVIAGTRLDPCHHALEGRRLGTDSGNHGLIGGVSSVIDQIFCHFVIHFMKFGPRPLCRAMSARWKGTLACA